MLRISMCLCLFLLLRSAEFDLNAQVVSDYPSEQAIVYGGSGFGLDGQVNLATYLISESTCKEIELVDHQRDAVQKMIREIALEKQLATHAFFKSYDSESPTAIQDFQAFQDGLKAKDESLNVQLSSSLLPHQIEQIKTIAFEQLLGGNGGTQLLGSPLVNALDLTDEEKESLLQKAKEIQKELQKRIAELRLEANRELLTELPPEKKARLAELYGISLD